VRFNNPRVGRVCFGAKRGASENAAGQRGLARRSPAGGDDVIDAEFEVKK
jgi:hypothetical protein